MEFLNKVQYGERKARKDPPRLSLKSKSNLPFSKNLNTIPLNFPTVCNTVCPVIQSHANQMACYMSEYCQKL